MLRVVGSLTVLAPISVQHFTFVILFGSFHYGGVSSPFFPWLGIVPLAGTFYLSGRVRLLALLPVGVQILAFYPSPRPGFALPAHVPAPTPSADGIHSPPRTRGFV